MGGASTSHSAVFSNRKESLSTSFDLQSWQGLTEVLKAGKEALKNPAEYAEFRNLVLGYAQGGGNHELKQKIDAITATFEERKNHAVEIPTETEVPNDITNEAQTPSHGNVYALSGRRRLPKFIPKVHLEKQDEVLSEAKPKTEAVHLPTKTSPKVVEPVQETVVKISSIPTQPLEVSHQETSEPKSLEEHKTRIAEIKRSVHEQVGNPAALVGAHNVAGKAYMLALLTALKATGAGNSDNVESVMQTLEKAYASLINDSASEKTESKPLIEEKVIESIEKPEPKIPEQSSIIIEEKAIKKQSVVEKEDHTIPNPEILPTEVKAPIVEQKPLQAVIPRTQGTREIPIKKQSTNTKPSGTFSSFANPFKKKVDIEKKVIKPVFEKSDFAAQETHTGYASSSEAPSIPDNTSELDGVGITKHTLRKLGTQPLETVEEEIGVHPKEVAVRQSELFTPEITEALGTLLNEWSTFSSSGLFGIGPGGSEHPLYRTLAPLSMGEVIAGRWEGTNPKIQKAIKEYIDAWRHEQGITYTINETFEHYLRRVVQKILKRQNQGVGAY